MVKHIYPLISPLKGHTYHPLPFENQEPMISNVKIT
jgi:hypothetical protein